MKYVAHQPGCLFRVQTVPHLQQESEQWGTHVKTAWSLDPQIALALVARFPSATTLKAEVASMVQVRFFCSRTDSTTSALCWNISSKSPTSMLMPW